MASCSRDGNSSDDDIPCVITKYNRKPKNVVRSDSDEDSDVEIKPKSKKKVKRLRESDVETDEDAALPRTNSISGSNRSADENSSAIRNDLSDGEQSEKCAICLSKFLGQDVATPENCDHTFCSECLQKWAKKVNTCPIDRLKFNLIFERHHWENRINRKISVENPNRFILVESDSSEATFCEFCGECESEDTLLLCDECELGFHCHCLNPPLESVPIGLWYCPDCAPFVTLHQEIFSDFQRLVQGRFRRHPSRQLVPREEPLDNIVNVREDNRLTAQSTTRLRPWQNSQSAELFSSDSSDENTDDNRSNTRRWHCQEIRNRRQQRWPSPLNSIRERIIAKMRRVNSVQRSFTPSPSTANNMQNLFTARALEELIDGFDDNGSVITHHPVSQPRIAHRAKELISSHSASNQNSTHAGSSFRSPSPPSSFDLVGDILQTQSIIHTPSVILQRDGTLSLNASTVGQQRPSNPAQKAASNNGGNSQQNATYASSSSSSSVSGSSQYYDHCNATGSAAVVTDGASAYGTDSCRTITNRSYGSTFLPDELKKDGHDASHSKETRKTHSDEEVDIYSDIESAGEEDTAMDEEVEPVRVAYKCNAPQLGNMGDGTDSSDNELIIDEDAHVEEDGERMKEKCKTNTDGKLMEMHHTEHSDAVGVSDDSGGSDLEESDHDQPCETNTEENINSFDGLDDASHENNSNLQLDHESNESYEHATGQTDVSHENNSNLQLDHESNESFEPAEGQTGKDNLPIKSDIESDIDSREENSVDNEADEENSLSSTKNSFFNTVEDRSGLGTPSPSETAIPIHKNSFEKCLERNANAESTTSPTIKRRDSIPAEDMEDIECDENAQPDDDENVAQPDDDENVAQSDDDDDENVAHPDDDDDENVAHPDDDENGAQPDDDDDENGAHPDDGENGAQPDAEDENVAQSDDDDDDDENLVQDEDENIAQSDENIAHPDDDDENVAQPDENDENVAQPDEDDENDAQPDEDDENGVQPDEDEEVDQVMNSNDGLLNNQNDGSEQITNENCSMQSDESGAQEGYESEVNNNENDDLPGNSELSEHSKHEHSELSEHSKHEHCDDNNVKDVKSDGEISDSEHSFAGILSKEETIAKNTNAENKCMQNSINDLRELLNYNRNLDAHPNKSKDASLSEQLKKYTNKKTWPRNNTEVSSECLSESYSQPTSSRFGYERNVASTEVECTSPTEMCKMNEKHHQMEINIENQDSTCFEQNVMDLNQSQNSETSPANEDGIVDTQNADLGIEDISEAGSDELNQNEGNIADIMECDSNDQLVLSAKQKELDDVEKNVAQLFNQDGDSLRKERKSMLKDGSSRNITNDSKNYYSSHQSSHMLEEDHEEGEIIEDLPLQKKDSRRDHKHDQYMHEDVEDYIDSIPRINISDLPRIPKIKRDGSKKNVPEELPLEVKRTSVLGRVDLGSSDISWKRLSKHTRERSYRDGRPKDERLLYREREGRAKDKKTKDNESERRGDEKYRESERKKDDSKKQEVEKCKDKNQHERSRDRKSDKNKDDYDKTMKSLEWGYGSQEKRDKEKHGKQHKDKHERDQKDRSKRERDKDRHDKSKERSNRDDDKYEREKVRNVERYDREIERYEQDEGRYEKITFEKEKPKEKEHKHKHKDRKSESGKKSCKDEKHKRSHSREHFTEKQREREVRKVDDKLKIVVEHKESRKDKADKHSEKKESKHEKKHRDSVHRHHEHRRKESITSPYTEIAPIESKEIFAKGDSIIINVNFNRASPKETVPFVEEEPCSRDKKQSCDLPKVEQLVIAQDIRISKSKHSLHDKDKNVLEILGNKRPTTPPERPERNTQMSVGECYWKETDDMDVKSPPFEKCSTEKICSDEEEDVMTPEENFGADDNFTDSDHDNLPETQVLLPKEEETEQSSILEKNTTESIYTKEIDSFNPPRRRSPRSPSPPSPPDNDSYDPCEPTRSPSPPPDLPAPPLPTMSMPERPKPPPSPELPPLPPEPEPMDVIMRDDPRAQKINPPCPSSEISPSSAVSNSITSQQAMLYTQTTVSSPLSMPNVLLPPPNFHPHSAPRNVSSVPQLVPPRTMNWQVSNPPPPPMLFPPNHVQQVIHGNFLSSQLPATGMPPNVSVTSQLGPMLQHANTLPIMSQVRHSQLSAHAAVPSNSLLPNVPLNHLNISQMQMQHLNHPPPNMSVTIPGQHQSISIPNQQNNLPVSVHNQAGIRVISSQGQLSNIIVSLQNQHSNSVTTVQSHVANHPVSAHSQVPIPTANIAVAPSQKLEKTKHSPTNERNEVVDMEVDSPYSPGDSPSMDSAYDYSPSVSPTTKNAPLSAFDTLLGPQPRLTTGQDSGTKAASEKTTNKRLGSDLKNSVDVPNKKAKSESRSESSGKVRHAVRLQVSDKVKTVSRREQKLVEKRLDDSQLKILDELPSSAVEMQVKEKFLKKLNRQERVVEEVKLALKPYYKTRDVNKEEYKDILRKSVPKICHNRSGDINPVKVKYLVECYVKKIKHTRKKASKKHKSKFS